MAIAAAAVLIARAPSMTFAAQAQESAPTLTSTAPADPAQVLADTILTEIGDRAATAAPTDLEGTIVFVLSQGDYAPAVIDAALNFVAQASPGAAMATALVNVRFAMQNQRTLRGTAGIPGSGGLRGAGGSSEVGSSSFSAPVTSGGGGGGASNYSV
ncbi:hypothetical protein BH10PSE13_BH10PSE13_04510 [soil metagenome]